MYVYVYLTDAHIGIMLNRKIVSYFKGIFVSLDKVKIIFSVEPFLFILFGSYS